MQYMLHVNLCVAGFHLSVCLTNYTVYIIRDRTAIIIIIIIIIIIMIKSVAYSYQGGHTG